MPHNQSPCTLARDLTQSQEDSLCNNILVKRMRRSYSLQQPGWTLRVLLLLLLFSRLVVSDSLRPHGLHHARLPFLHCLPELLRFMSTESVMPFNHLILCHPLLPSSIFPSIRESVLPIRWPKYWSFSFSTSPSNEYSGLISFRMDRLDLLAVQGTLKSLL